MSWPRARRWVRSPSPQIVEAEAKKLRAVLDLLDEKLSIWRTKFPPGHASGLLAMNPSKLR
jgi:hypothetical protein